MKQKTTCCNPSQRLKHGERGMAMFVVIGLLAVLMMLSGTMFVFLHQSATHLNTLSKRQVCLNLAEAGIDKALAELQAGQADYAGEQHTPLGDGFFSVTVKRQEDGSRLIDASGLLADGAVRVAEARITALAVLDERGALRRLTQHEVR